LEDRSGVRALIAMPAMLASRGQAALLSLLISALPARAEEFFDPDAQLRDAVGAMREGSYGAASRVLEGVVKAEPNFRLAQLLYGQALALRSGARIGSPLSDDGDPQLKELLDEYHARTDGVAAVPAAGLLPNIVLRLADETRYALVVDLPNTRMYLMRNGEDGPRLVRSFYSAIARNGYGKQAAGDLRTPVGVYHVTGWTPGAQLPSLYGAGAFPLNYPNSWDRSRGKSGYGIWLHGVPPTTYARAPHSSEGCVTLANRDLLSLQGVVKIGATPVILADKIDWLPASQIDEQRESLLDTIERWRTSWTTLDTERYLGFYAADFRTDDGLSRRAFAGYKRRINAGKKHVDVALSEINLFAYPGESGLIVAQFTQDYHSDNFTSASRKDQYWRRQPDGDWKIVREENR
jgi:murein L,D-transpeptidase YafK